MPPFKFNPFSSNSVNPASKPTGKNETKEGQKQLADSIVSSINRGDFNIEQLLLRATDTTIKELICTIQNRGLNRYTLDGFLECVKDKKEILAQQDVQDVLKKRAISYLNDATSFPRLSIKGLLPYIEDRKAFLASPEVQKFVNDNVISNGYFSLDVFEYATDKEALLTRPDVRHGLRETLVEASKKGKEATFERVAALSDQDIIKGAVLRALERSVDEESVDKLIALVDNKDEFFKDPKIRIAKIKEQILSAVYKKESISPLLENESQEVIEQLFISYIPERFSEGNILKQLALKASLETFKNLITKLGVDKCLDFFRDRTDLLFSEEIQSLLKKSFIDKADYYSQDRLSFIANKEDFFSDQEIQDTLGKVFIRRIQQGDDFSDILPHLKDADIFFARVDIQELLKNRYLKGSVRQAETLFPYLNNFDINKIDSAVVQEKVVEGICYGESVDNFIIQLGLEKESIIFSDKVQEMLKSKFLICLKDDDFSLENIVPYIKDKDTFFADSELQKALRGGILLRTQRGNFVNSYHYLLNFATKQTRDSLPSWLKL